MRNSLEVVRAYLVTLSDITDITGTSRRLRAGQNLHPGYKPSDGSCLLFNVRSGSQDYTSGWLMPSIQFRSYGEFSQSERPDEGEAAAIALDQALHEAVNDTTYEIGEIAYFRMEDGTFPTLLTEPGSEWPYVLSFYRVHIRND